MMQRRLAPLRGILAAASLVGVVLAGRGLSAQEADAPPVEAATEARQQYAAGSQAFAAKRFVEAALHFEAAAAQRAHAVTLYTAALAWEQANRPERACDDYGRALEVPGLSAQQAGNARDRVAALEKTLGTLVVTAPPQDAGWRVQLVGLSEVAAPGRLHAAPGVHQLLAHAPNRPIQKRDVTLEIGQTTRLELEAEAAAPVLKEPTVKREREEAPTRREADRSPSSPTTGASPRKSAGFVALGVGVAALGAGAILGSEALDARDAYNSAPARATLDHAQGLQTWTTVAFVFGAALTVGGLVLVLLPESKSTVATARLAIAPSLGGAALRGAF